MLALALGRRRGLSCLDMSIYVLPQFSFVARPVFPSDMTDPIERPVSLYEGAKRRVDVDALLSELSVDLARDQHERARQKTANAEERLLDVDPGIRYELIERLVAAIPNNLEREKWIGVAHAIQGAFGDDYSGREIWLALCNRRTTGTIDSRRRRTGLGYSPFRQWARGHPRAYSTGGGGRHTGSDRSRRGREAGGSAVGVQEPA